jgi:hypothetical protein
MQALKSFASMQKFSDRFHRPNSKGGDHWGILMLCTPLATVTAVTCEALQHAPIVQKKLTNRFQLWKISQNQKDSYLALGHFPFSGDEHISNKEQLSNVGQLYGQFIQNVLNQYSSQHLVFCADFNFHPYLINRWQDRVMDKIPLNNSIVAINDSQKAVSVDGILLSNLVKAKNDRGQPGGGLLKTLKLEHALWSSKNIAGTRSIAKAPALAIGYCLSTIKAASAVKFEFMLTKQCGVRFEVIL